MCSRAGMRTPSSNLSFPVRVGRRDWTFTSRPGTCQTLLSRNTACRGVSCKARRAFCPCRASGGLRKRSGHSIRQRQTSIACLVSQTFVACNIARNLFKLLLLRCRRRKVIEAVKLVTIAVDLFRSLRLNDFFRNERLAGYRGRGHISAHSCTTRRIWLTAGRQA